MLKENIKKYLKKKKMAPGALADLAGVKRYSVSRFVNEKKAGLNYRTAEKLILYMNTNP